MFEAARIHGLRHLVLVFALAMTVAACASSQESRTGTVDIGPGVTLALPDRPPFGAEANVVQLGQATYQDRTVIFQAVISSTPGTMALVMTLPSGPRVMSFTWSDGALKSKLESIAPKGLSADHMLADIMLIYAPADLLRQVISGADLVERPDGSRSLVRDGKELITVIRTPDASPNIWIGRATLENKAFGYRLSIDSRALGAN